LDNLFLKVIDTPSLKKNISPLALTNKRGTLALMHLQPSSTKCGLIISFCSFFHIFVDETRLKDIL
jgi:hypothetical protein